MLTHLLAFAAGAALVWLFCKTARPASTADLAPPAGKPDPMCATDLDLDADIIAFISENQVFHINDVCRSIEHPKGARFVRAHFHRLMEQGKIRYRDMRYMI